MQLIRDWSGVSKMMWSFCGPCLVLLRNYTPPTTPRPSSLVPCHRHQAPRLRGLSTFPPRACGRGHSARCVRSGSASYLGPFILLFLVGVGRSPVFVCGIYGRTVHASAAIGTGAAERAAGACLRVHAGTQSWLSGDP